ncbi:hypothetical protein [Butyrivibrio fibrisolvens]|uniref:hypothetical protein n=1 Tax=Butyrivibrio fibrisolvens TaxID=831 RepID=UPI0003F4CA05|nr:hypothetical protein [Butyrivibrio fibrisolvens]
MSEMGEGRIIKKGKDGGWTKEYDDGTIEIKRFTKVRHQERHDFINPVTGDKTTIWKY